MRSLTTSTYCIKVNFFRVECVCGYVCVCMRLNTILLHQLHMFGLALGIICWEYYYMGITAQGNELVAALLCGTKMRPLQSSVG